MLSFTKPSAVKLSGTKSVSASSARLGAFRDDPIAKLVSVDVWLFDAAGKDVGRKSVVIWAGDAYDAAGQYTDADIQARVLAIATAGKL